MSALTEALEVPAHLLEQIHARLTERRILVEKEVLKYGEAPAGIKEVFELCRGFERAYVEYINESPAAGKVKEAFMGEKGLSGQVRKAPIEKVFQLSNVKAVCRYADGYQPHLVSPEHGMRALGVEAMDLVTEPVRSCVRTVHNLLLAAGKEAAEKAGHYTEAALVGALPMYVPDFKTVVIPAIVSALDEWKLDAEKMCMMLVDMERSYITAGFFRHTMHNRYERIKQQEAMALAGQGVSKESGAFGAVSNAAKNAKSYFPAFGAAKEPERPSPPPPKAGGAAPKDDSDGSGDEKSTAKSGSQANFSNMSSGPNDFVAAYFDKYGTDWGKTQNLPSSWRWQRRFFIFSDSQRMIYYFKSPEDVPKANGLRGQINIAECIIEDLDERGQPRHAGSPPASTSDKMIMVRHKDPRQSVMKEHNSVVLRAETTQAKTEWLGRLRKAAGQAAKPVEKQQPKPQAQPQQGHQPGPAGPEDSPASFNGGMPAVGPESANGHATGFRGDLSWAKDAEPTLDTHLGQGARFFRAESLRDSEGRLPPAPRVLLNPLRAVSTAESVVDKVKQVITGSTVFEQQYDALLEQCGADMCIYTRMVCDTICVTVPKAIVHCMIKKSQASLLERLFTVMHKLTPQQMEQLLREDDEIVQRRKLTRKVFEDIKSAVFQVHQMMERQALAAPAERPEKVTLQVNAFAYAGMPNLLTPEQRSYFDKLFADQHAPECLRGWASGGGPALPSTRPTPASQQQQQAAGRSHEQQQQQGPAAAAPYNGPRGPPPLGGPGAALGPLNQRPAGPPPVRAAAGPGAAPPVPMRPAPGAAPGPVRRPPPPPPGGR